MNQVPPPPPPPPPPGGVGGGGGYVGPSGSSSAEPFDIGAAISWGWAKFQANIGILLLAFLGVIAAVVVSWVVQIAVAVAIDNAVIAQLLTSAISIVFSMVGSYFIYQAALQLARGETPTPQSIFDFSKFGVFFVPTLISSIIIGIGFALCIIPGLILFPLLMFTPYYALDKGLGGFDAVKASWDRTTKEPGKVILFGIVLGLFAALGLIVCCIGAIVTGLITHLGTARAYTLAEDGTVAA